MSFYALILYLHSVAALGIFATLGIEWAGLTRLRRATSATQLHESINLLGGLRRVGGPSALLLLLSGMYLGAARWGFQTWIVLGIVGLVVIALAGAMLTGRRLGAIARAVATAAAPTPALVQRVHDPVLVVSAWFRTVLGLGVVFLMVTKPATLVAWVVFAMTGLLGIVIGFAAGSRNPAPQTTPSAP